MAKNWDKGNKLRETRADIWLLLTVTVRGDWGLIGNFSMRRIIDLVGMAKQAVLLEEGVFQFHSQKSKVSGRHSSDG